MQKLALCIYDLMLFSNSMYKIINFDDVVGQIQ